jgi:predicted neutral ceramidase superfamily lipid hydrolase
MVNGIVPAKLGYHPVGEAVDEKIFLKKVVSVFSEAKRNLVEGEASSISFETRVKTLGLGLFKNMTELIYHASKLVAFSTIPTILISAIVFILVLIRP